VPLVHTAYVGVRAGNVFRSSIVLLSREGSWGWGEAPHTGDRQGWAARQEHLARAEEVVAAVPAATTLSWPALEELEEQLCAVAPPWVASGVSMAWCDWVARRLNRSVPDILGVPRLPVVPSTLTVSAPNARAVADRLSAVAHGIAIKLKIRGVIDPAFLDAARRFFAGELSLDANATLTEGEYRNAVPALAAYGVARVEQPLARLDVDLRTPGGPMIVADEEVVSPEAIERLFPYVDGVVLKVARLGGLARARRALLLARSLGLEVRVGCFGETDLGTAASCLLAALGATCDLDSHRLTRTRPFLGVEGGLGTVGAPAGIGWGVRQAEHYEGELPDLSC